MSPGDWNDDEHDGPAPLPAHERTWRHPSEMGEANWLRSEPPLAIGRGLSAATGAVGTLLALAVLWTMLPTQAGRSAVVTTRSTSTLRPETSAAAQLTTAVTDTQRPPASATVGAIQTAADDTRPASSGGPTTVTAPRPMPTYQVQHTSTLDNSAVAVAVNGGALIITTAGAVAADHSVDLLLPNGQLDTARVLFVDDRIGLAVLAPGTGSAALSFTVATTIEPGDELTFFGDEQTTFTVPADGSMQAAWADDLSIREGTPVVNQRGELVALCSHDADGAGRLVPLANLDELQQAIAGYNGTAKVWLGIVLNDDPAGKLTIGAVDPAGPAAAAGLTAGDEVTAIDTVAVADSTALGEALSAHLPGDVVQLDIRHADGTTATVAVTLAAPKTSL
ncbi:MAG: PDZ domain-containing protein [Actinomycetota bacterium]|nr:PDZ domain-containing protein [Actinomycetota bacterium]